MYTYQMRFKRGIKSIALKADSLSAENGYCVLRIGKRVVAVIPLEDTVYIIESETRPDAVVEIN